MRAGGIPNRVATNKPTVPSFDEESDLGVDRFRVAWRNAFRDPSFVQYVQRKLPSSLDAMHDFDRNGNFSEDPSGYMNFLYDAVTALGISMCRAGSNVTFFGGVDIYSQFRRLDFEGASGRNKILNETGTRSYTTTSFIAWNVRVTDEVSNGEAVLEYVPSYVLDGEGWKGVSGNAFEFADGTTIAPASIPPVAFNDNYIGAPSKVIAYCLMAGVMISSAGAVVWTYYYRRDHVVDSAQPLFLVMAALGAFIMVLSIVPLSLEETVTTNKQTLDTACMLTPWLYFTGAGIAASGLLAKAKAVHKVR
jgi:7 transmembrane sweet-taste receptor of 3 GCPR